jgi:hypothetical protein
MIGTLEMTTNYYTQYNGAVPFRVEIQDENVKVYVEHSLVENDDQNEENYSNLVASFKPKHIFIGSSPLTKMTNFSGGFGDEWNGNSILLHMSDLNYVFIGTTIYSFEAKYEIVKYVSEVGNNCIPYPYAVDKYNYHYLMIENVVFINDHPQTMTDPYEWYYDHHYLTSMRPGGHPSAPRHVQKKNQIKYIKDFRIGAESYAFNYRPEPELDYDRISYFDDDDPNKRNTVSVIKHDGFEKILSKKDYVELMEEFGNKMKFSKLPNKKIIYGET